MKDQLIQTTEAWLESPVNKNREEAVAYAGELLKALQKEMKSNPQAGKTIGPLLGKVKSLQKRLGSMELVQWVRVGGGHLAIGHRPGVNLVTDLKLQNATHILTLLAESEGAREIEKLTKKNALQWLWFPMASAQPPGEERTQEALTFFSQLQKELEKGARVYLHCSAGIHRTGMITYAYLRYTGMEPEEAQKKLTQLRVETGEGVGQERMQWGDRLLKFMSK